MLGSKHVIYYAVCAILVKLVISEDDTFLVRKNDQIKLNFRVPRHIELATEPVINHINQQLGHGFQRVKSRRQKELYKQIMDTLQGSMNEDGNHIKRTKEEHLKGRIIESPRDKHLGEVRKTQYDKPQNNVHHNKNMVTKNAGSAIKRKLLEILKPALESLTQYEMKHKKQRNAKIRHKKLHEPHSVTNPLLFKKDAFLKTISSKNKIHSNNLNNNFMITETVEQKKQHDALTHKILSLIKKQREELSKENQQRFTRTVNHKKRKFSKDPLRKKNVPQDDNDVDDEKDDDSSVLLNKYHQNSNTNIPEESKHLLYKSKAYRHTLP